VCVCLYQATVNAYVTDLSSKPSVTLCMCVHQSVCPESVLWQNNWVDSDAVWDGEQSWSRDGCIRWGWSKGRGNLGFFTPIGPMVSMTYFYQKNVLNSCVKSGRYFHMDSISLNLYFTGFPKIQSSSRLMLGFVRNLQKCNSQHVQNWRPTSRCSMVWRYKCDVMATTASMLCVRLFCSVWGIWLVCGQM